MTTARPKENPYGRNDFRHCECGRCIEGMSEEAIKEHEQSALHTRWLNWSEHQEQVKEKKKEHNVKVRDSEAYKEAQQKRVERDRESGWARQKQYSAQRYICDCGCNIRRGNLYEHQKTKKHIRLLAMKIKVG